MIAITTDFRAFKRSVQQAVRSGPDGRRAGLLTLAKVFGEQVLNRSPVYTGRYKAAEAQSLNAVGVGPFPVQAIARPKRSKWQDSVDRRLAKQVAFWTKRSAEIVAKGEHQRIGKKGKVLKGESKVYRNAQKKLALARKYQAEWYASDKTAAVLNLKSPSYDKMTRAMQKVYGGTGTIIEGSGQTVMQLHNREPHASIVESKRGLHRTALATATGGLLATVGRSYVKRIAAVSGMAVTA